MNKLTFSIHLLALMMLLVWGCNRPEDKLTGELPPANAVDVSERIMGFDSDVTGAGAMVTANGTDLAEVKRVIISGNMSPMVDASADQVTFQVPNEVDLGPQEVFFIFSGDERATKIIEIVPRPIISSIDPLAAYAGGEVVIRGNNLNYVNTVRIGMQEASITETRPSLIAFEVPSGVMSDYITLVSDAGDVVSEALFLPCEMNSDLLLCQTPVNANPSFEEGDLGLVPDVAVPAWGFGGAGDLAAFEVVGEPTRGGRQAMKVEILDIGANPWNIELRQETFTVSPNTTYQYSVKVNGPAGARVDFTVGRPDFSELNRVEATLEGGGWEEITMQFTTGAEDFEIRLPMHFSREENRGGVFYIDNLRIVEGEGGGGSCTYEIDPVCFCNNNPTDIRCLPDPLNVNGGFEQAEVGTVGGEPGQISVPEWSFGGANSLATISVVDDEVFFGERALLVEVIAQGDNPWNIELLQSGLVVEPNTTYIYSIRAKGTGNAEAHFTLGLPDFSELGREEAVLTDEWTEYTYEFTTGENDTEIRMPTHLSFAANVGQMIYIDELRIMPVE